jgi:hypothetical protein
MYIKIYSYYILFILDYIHIRLYLYYINIKFILYYNTIDIYMICR